MDVVGTFLFEIIVNIRLVNINKVARIEVIFVKKLPAVLDDINDSCELPMPKAPPSDFCNKTTIIRSTANIIFIGIKKSFHSAYL